MRIVVSLLAAAALAVLEELTDGTAASFESLVAGGLTAAVAQLSSYQILWKELDVNDRVLPDVGLGPTDAPMGAGE